MGADLKLVSADAVQACADATQAVDKLVSADAVQACADEAQAVDKLVYADAVQASGPPPCKLFLQ